jgi:succinate dehydrogenase / fumarate reductase cytochrome b subunit
MNKASWNPIKLPVERYILPVLEHLPVVSFYARTRGWPFIIAWTHRITGLLLALYFFVHIYTLSFLASPVDYDSKMKIFGFFILSFLEWLLAVPVIFHALNGGRLILFEVFGRRNDESLIRWVLGLSATYILLLGLMMIRQDQSASLIVYWLPILVFSISLVYLVSLKIRRTENSMAWKLHRMTGVYLLLMIPAHLLFMHLEPAIAHEANTVINRMQHVSVKLLDLTLVLGVSYHTGYGLVSICKDYLPPGSLQNVLTFLIALTIAVLGWVGMKLTILI